MISDYNITPWSVLDVVIVAYLMYLIYRLLKGTAAFNIFIGVVLLYFIYWVVGALEMKLLSLVLGKFVGYGVLILIIIFQPEVRSFLVMLGNTTLKGRGKFLEQLFGKNESANTQKDITLVNEIKNAIISLSKDRYGALIVISDSQNVRYFENSGIKLNALVSEQLIRNIFEKNAPLHDGAMVIVDDRIHAASVVLPVSGSSSISRDLGLRHRAAIGVTESSNVVTFIVSEETGEISYTSKGKLYKNISKTELQNYLLKHLNNT